MTVRLGNTLLCVVGPTASGKTAVAQLAAELLGASVLSADSMQVYKGMDVGTGKIAEQDRTVDYYGLDLVDPGQAFSVSLYQEYGRSVIESLDSTGVSCVVCGGTGFYVRALVDDFSFPSGEQVGNPVRERYSAMLAADGPQGVWQQLHDVDPESALVIPVNDSKRVIRALELHEEGLSYAEQKAKFESIPPYYLPVCIVGLSVEPDVLAVRINERGDAMVEGGLVDEVRGLLSGGYREAITAGQAIGYKEIAAAVDGQCSLEEAIDRVKRSTRQYAKRQRTWFRKDKRIRWLDATSAPHDDLARRACALLEPDARSAGE